MMVVMISEKKEGDSYPTLYRIENYNDNFKIGSYPQYATENFKVSFYFRLNGSSPWQEYIYEFKVDYQARISLQDYNQQEIKYFYLKKDETEDLQKILQFNNSNISRFYTNVYWLERGRW